MKDWDNFARTYREAAKTTGTTPSKWDYLIIKATDNSLAISVFILTIFFASIGLFYFDSTQPQQTNWSLHASELCLGVFLGLLKQVKR
jgi:hypothetical protein